MNKVMQVHGRSVFTFDWTSVAGEPFVEMARANAAVLDAANGSQARLEALAGDPDFTEQGRRKQMRLWLDEQGLPALAQGRSALRSAEQEISRIGEGMKPRQPEKDDLAGALLRQEIRGWLRGMDDAKRNAILSVDVDPVTALAITEAPAVLSSVTSEQRERLVSRAASALYPKEGERIARIEDAAEALSSTMRAAALTMSKAAQISPMELESLMGSPSLIERISARLGETA